MTEETKKEMAKAYEPKLIEDKWYTFWETSGFFKADSHSSKPAYTIVMPPPNVTGVLHMGHALVDTLQDVLIRWKRMSGFEALWIPGTDHAGIATQTVVERNLIAKEGKRRFEYSREEFLSHVWKWKEESETHILHQIRKLGCSCDWSRLAFTMDEKRSVAVRTIFKKMFDDGLIYRGDYLVNWDPYTQTALADDEVEHEERDSFLWLLRYPLEDKSGYITVATTRPETMLGDVAIAVSPKDERYEQLIGKKAVLPFTNRMIPILADPFVEPEFGTGAVKITPAHDPNDYEMGLRHSLPMINIMTPDGKINEEGKQFAGLTMEEARNAVVSAMKDLNLLEKAIPHKNRVGVSYRSKAVIEPYLSKQWFVKMSAFKDKLKTAVEEKRVTLVPPHWESTYFHWINNLRDWCISRQLWWGHRIPIWYNKNNPEQVLCFAGEGLPSEVKANPDAWVQDEDVLDTWFSSGLWPFSTLGWPEKSADLQKFYPNSTLITGHDILFFWIARMILMGEYTLEAPPFHQTFVHGLIYGKSYWRYKKDGSIAYVSGKERLAYDLGEPIPAEVSHKWEKMSKSKGNIIDPIEIIETYGADAMRMALCASTTYARQIDLDRRRFEEYKNFANKVWNGARYVLMNLETLSPTSISKGLDTSLFTLEDKWILSLLNRTINEVTKELEKYAFDKAATLSYEFFWKEFCAYYVELTKPYLFDKVGTQEQKENKQKLLLIVLSSLMRLMHPMAPFITEEIFEQLKEKCKGITPTPKADPYTRDLLTSLEARACIVSTFPKALEETGDRGIEETFAFIDQVLHSIRNIRAEMQLAPGTMTDLIIIGKDKEKELTLVQSNEAILKSLVKLGKVTYAHHETAIPMSATAVISNLKLIIPLPEEMREREKLRLTKEKEKLIAQQNTARTQLANPDFVQKAPPPLVQKIQNTLDQAEKELTQILKKLQEL